MYKTMHEKANASTKTATPASSSTPQTQPPTTRSSAPQPPQSVAPANATQSTNAAPTKLDKTFFDLLTDVTAELIVESAKLDRLGRYLTKNPKNQNSKK